MSLVLSTSEFVPPRGAQIVFTGREDEQRSFLLSSRDILNEFEEIEDGGKAVLRLRGAKLIDRSNYEVTHRKLALDRIEHALKNADFWANRRFIWGIRYVELNPDQIDHDLTMPLDNGWVDIQKQFFKGKKKLQSTLFDMERIVDALGNIVRATDPMEASRIYEEEIAEYISHRGLRDEIQVPCDFFDEDFFGAVQNHRARLAKLKELGIEGSYFKLIEYFNAAVLKKLQKLLDNSELVAVKISVTYDRETLCDPAIEVTPTSLKGHEPEVLTSERGAQIVVARIPEEIHEIDIDDREMVLKEHLWRLRRPFQLALDRIYLGEGVVAWS